MKKILIILIAVLGVNVTAQSDLSRGHLKGDGLYASWSVGVGLLAVNDRITDGGSSSIQTKGGAGGTNIRIGAAIKDNLVLHAGLLTGVSGALSVKSDGDGSGIISGADNLVMRIYAGGVSYYFMPSNIFVSGSLGLGTLEIRKNLEEIVSDPGLGLIAKVGKDWWISKNWDLGLSFELGYLRVNTKPDGMTEVVSGLLAELSINVTFH